VQNAFTLKPEKLFTIQEEETVAERRGKWVWTWEPEKLLRALEKGRKP